MTPAQQMRQGYAEQTDEALTRIAGVATTHELALTTTREHRLCTCDDNTHPEPHRGDGTDWQWTTSRARLVDIRRYYPGPPHIVTRRRAQLVGPIEEVTR